MKAATTNIELRDLQISANAEIRGCAWPTIGLSVASFSGICLNVALAARGDMPVVAASLINIPLLIAAYTGVHEAVHANLHGRNRRMRWLDTTFGVTLTALFVHSFTMHRFVHLAHHSHTNDRVLDPDAWMAAKSFGGALLRAPLLLFSYFTYVIRRKSHSADRSRFAIRVILEMAPPILVVTAMTAAGYGWVALFAWIIPAVAAVSVMAIILDWLPHHPHEGGNRFDSTRIIAPKKNFWGAAFTWAYLFQNFHLIHHLFPRVPFYAYERLFRRGEAALAAMGATIVNL